MPKLTNGERLAVIETEISGLKDDVQEIKTMLKEHVDWETNKYENLKKDFAAKWVESISVAIIGAVATAVIVGVVYLL